MGLALLLWCLPVHAQEEESSQAEEEVQEQAPEAAARKNTMYLILGGTLVGVSGMWLNLYRRGKGSK